MRIGLSLSGGASPGYLQHLALYCALENLGIEVEEIAGTSAGSIVAALIAGGVPVEEILEKVPVTKEIYAP
ncbi:MAG: hypothetical protein GF368_00370 [Candidatus Aenigmarchaeota archaeon]|nr:hypothetical protein [Candidatus Aenigmarchaeota archaeon]